MGIGNLVQRSRPLRQGPAGGPAGQRAGARIVRLHVGASRAHRSGQQLRADWARLRRARSASRGRHRRPDRLGAGDLRALPGAAQRRRERRGLLPRGVDDWAAPSFDPNSPGRTYCTASGCVARSAGDARAARAAYDMFAAIGMEAFAERACRELRATGETVRQRTVETLDELLPGGPDRLRRRASNPEIAAQLFLPAHGRVPPTQGVRQARDQLRRQLQQALPDGASAGPMA